MSAKLKGANFVFPTILEKEILEIFVTPEYSVKIPIPWMSQTFVKDSTYYENPDILAYLVNSQYKLIFRFDGTVTVYTTDDYVRLTKTFEVPKELIEFDQVNRSCVFVEGKNVPYASKIYILNFTEYMYIDNNAFYKGYRLKGKDNLLFMHDICDVNVHYPALKYNAEDNTLTKVDMNKESYTLYGEFTELSGIANII